MHRTLIAATALAVTGLASTASAQLVLTLRNTIDVESTAGAGNAEFIGSNPSAVGYNGDKLYVAGFNNGPQQPVGIVEILDPTVDGPASYGTVFGVQAATPFGRGYSGLAMDPVSGDLAAAYDVGSSSPQGLVEYDTATNTPNFNYAIRGGSGVDYDPGFMGVDSGIGITTFGSGRRALVDDATGAEIYSTANGFIFNSTGRTFNRDYAFDPDTGDLYSRANNQVLKSARTGGNAATNTVLASDPAFVTTANVNLDAPFVNGQNIAFGDIDGFDFLVTNDRTGAGGGLPTSYVGFDPAASLGTGYYDFAYDADSQTLAVLDFNNRDVLIFDVVIPEPATASLGLAAFGGLLLRNRRRA